MEASPQEHIEQHRPKNSEQPSSKPSTASAGHSAATERENGELYKQRFIQGS